MGSRGWPILIVVLYIAVLTNTALSQSEDQPASRPVDTVQTPSSQSVAPAPQIAVRLCGLKIFTEAFTTGNGEEIGPFPTDQGTEISLLCLSPSGGLVRFDDDKSNLEILADDTGQTLMGDGSPSYTDGFGRTFRVSNDGQAAFVTIKTKAIPAQGAKEVRLKAKLQFRVGSKKIKFVERNAPLKAGTQITGGLVPLSIKTVGPALTRSLFIESNEKGVHRTETTDQDIEVVLASKKSMDSIAEIRFLDMQGKAIKTDITGTRVTNIFGVKSEARTYKLAGQPEFASIEVSYWTDLTNITVPVDIKVSVGISAPR